MSAYPAHPPRRWAFLLPALVLLAGLRDHCDGAAEAEPSAGARLRPPVSPFGNVEEFPPVEARFVRVRILETNGGTPILDELEVFSAEPDPRNVALRDAGAIPSASATGVVVPIHQLRNLNDGRYGNDASWMASGSEARTVAQQRVDVGSLADVIDHGVISAELSALVGGWGDQADSMTIRAVFLDGDQRTTGDRLSIGPVTPLERGNRSTLLPRSGTARVPSGTRSIAVSLSAERAGGEFNDGYADNVTLVLRDASGSHASLVDTNLLVNPGGEEDGPVSSENRAPPKGWTVMEGGLTVFPYSHEPFGWNPPPAPAQGQHLFIGGQPSAHTEAWVQIELPQVTRINRVVWSRDRTGREVTRTPTRYRIEVATRLPDWRVVATSDDREPSPDLIELPMASGEPRPPSRDIRSWTEAEGLPANAVNDLAQTPEGYLWISTDHGLARFDGAHFKVFDRHNVPELGTSAFGSLHCDPTGRLWIQLKLPPGSSNNLAQYHRGRFMRLETRGQTVRSVRVDSNGTPWGFCETGVFPWRNGGLDTNAPLTSLPGKSPANAFHDSTNGLWLSERDQIGKLVESSSWSVLTNQAGAPVALGTSGPILGTPRAAGGAWLATGGLSQYGSADFGPNLLRPLRPDGRLEDPKPIPGPKRSFELIALVEDASGNLWVAAGIPEYALYRVAADGQHQERYSEGEGLSDSWISALLPDRNGNLWVGTRRGGVHLLRPRAFQTLPASRARSTPDVVSVAPARENGVWLCSNQRGLYRWNEGRLFRLFTPSAPFAAVLEDSEGAVWSSGWLLGGKRYDFHQHQWIDVMRSSANEFSAIVALFQDRRGRVWMGGSFGLASYDRGQPTAFRPPYFDRQPPDSVIAIAESGDGAIWLGTQAGHLHRFHDDRFRTVWQPDTKHSGPVCALHFDDYGTLWFARFGGGLSRFENEHLTHYGAAEGLPTSTLNGILGDGRGQIWFTSKSGVYRISRDDLHAFARGNTSRARWQNFTKHDGLPSLECHGENNQPSLCRTADGRIWIPTLQGVAYVDESVHTAPPPPSVVIEEVRLHGDRGQVKSILADGDFLRHAGPDPLEIIVPPGHNTLTFHYTGIDFDDPELVTFRYRVPGLNPDWVDVQGTRTATCSGIGPGTYRFELAAMNKGGARTQPAVLRLRVLPFWWETRAFRGLLVLIVVAVGPGIYLYRVHTLKRRQRLQEAFSRQLIQREEDERKRIAQEVHDVLGHDLVLLRNSAVQGGQDADSGSPAQTQFEQISGLASRALNETRAISHRLRPVELDRLGLRHALETLLRETTTSAGLRIFQELPDIDPVISPETQVYFYRLFQEALTNVVKHARAKTVMVEIAQEPGRIVVRLEDDGVGFEVGDRLARGGGMGLRGMQERVHLLGGEFHLTSAPGQGTRIRITVPVAVKLE